MKTTPIKISYLPEVSHVNQIATTTYLLLAYNDGNTNKSNAKISSENFLSDYTKNTTYASSDGYGLVKVQEGSGLNNDNGVISVNTSYIISEIRKDPTAYASVGDETPGLVAIKTTNGLNLDKNGVVSISYASDSSDPLNVSYGVVRASLQENGDPKGILITNGVMDINTSYILEDMRSTSACYAEEDKAGMVKVGPNIDYSYGMISLTYAKGDKAGLSYVSYEHGLHYVDGMPGYININVTGVGTYGVVKLDEVGKGGLYVDLENNFRVDGSYIVETVLSYNRTNPNSYSSYYVAGAVKVGYNIDYVDGMISLTYANETKAGLAYISTSYGLHYVDGMPGYIDINVTGIDKYGVVKLSEVGQGGLYVDPDNKFKVDTTYVIKTIVGYNSTNPNSYSSYDVAGAVKVGYNIDYDNGRISLTYADGLKAGLAYVSYEHGLHYVDGMPGYIDINIADQEKYGVVKVVTNSGIDNHDGALSLNTSYIIEEVQNSSSSYASDTKAGTVKIGYNIDYKDGVISLTYADGYKAGLSYVSYEHGLHYVDNMPGYIDINVTGVGNYGVVKLSEVGKGGLYVDPENNFRVDTTYIIDAIVTYNSSDPNSYASDTKAGVVKVGSNIDYKDGTISLTYADGKKAGLAYISYEHGLHYVDNVPGYIDINYATNDTYGVVKVGKGLDIENGKIMCNAIYVDYIVCESISNINCAYGATGVKFNIIFKAGNSFAWEPKTLVTNYKINGCKISLNDNVVDEQLTQNPNSDNELQNGQFTYTMTFEDSILEKQKIRVESLTVEDKEYKNNNKINKTGYITPRNYIYYGMSSKEKLTETNDINSLTNEYDNGKIIVTSFKDFSATIKTVKGQYLWICIPKSLELNNKLTGVVDIYDKNNPTKIVIYAGFTENQTSSTISYIELGQINNENYYCYRTDMPWKTDGIYVKFSLS